MRETSRWRAVWIGGRYFPLVFLFSIYAAFNSLVPCVLLVADATTASPFWSNTTLTDGLGGRFSITGVLHPSWMDGLEIALIFGMVAQRAMFVAWAVFGLGKWHVRYGVALISSAFLYAIVQVRLGEHPGRWQDCIAPLLAMPLEFLALAAPLAVSAVWSGRRLRHKCDNAPYQSNARHFSLANLLWLTTAVAVSVALARWKETIGGDTLANSVQKSLVVLLFPTIYVLPLCWIALAIRRLSLALILLASITALFATPFVIAARADGEWAVQLLSASGFILTVPCSLLLWRICGYRLAPAMPRRDGKNESEWQQMPDASTLPGSAP